MDEIRVQEEKRGTGTISEIRIVYENGTEVYTNIQMGNMKFQEKGENKEVSDDNNADTGQVGNDDDNDNDTIKGGGTDDVEIRGGKKSRKPKSKRIRVRKTRRRKH